MTNDQYIIQRKLNIVELAKALGNVSAACQKLQVSRQHHYDIKHAVAEQGLEGLLAKSRNSPRHQMRLAKPIEDRILAYSLEYPSRGAKFVAAELKSEGLIVSSGGVRCVWLRHKLTTRKERLKRLEVWAAEAGHILSAEQAVALERAKDDKIACGEVETHHPGFLVGQDTYYVGFIKGVGRIYQQTAIDTFSNVGFAKLYSDKTALTAADALNDKVLPFFDGHKLSVQRVLTDRGGEYCGKLGHHPYELFLQLQNIEHTKTKPYRPQTNGITEKLNQTIQQEFYAVEFRRRQFTSLDDLQGALDAFMERYNGRRPNQGKHCRGRTPLATFIAGIELYRKLVHVSEDLH